MKLLLCQIWLHSLTIDFTDQQSSTPDLWVFGVISTAMRPARGYYEVVASRNRATLLPILRKCLQPNHVARHDVFVHADNFVEPVTGVHTQEAESGWANLKETLKRLHGISRDDLQAYLDNRMWRQWRGQNSIMANFLLVLSSQYRDYIV